MHVIRARGVNQAWHQALQLMAREGIRTDSRNGPVSVVPAPVATVYECPTERVLFDPVRDANPIFHLHEALWMLAGRDDATWLDRFVSDFSSRFAETGGRIHGAYGRRWRDWFQKPAKIATDVLRNPPFDQLDEVVRLLRENPNDRQAVIGMWDPSADLGVPGLRDRPCNTQIYLRCDRLVPFQADVAPLPEHLRGMDNRERLLDMTVLCRSNDVIFGCYGANVVHFSMLQEYLAARIGVGVGEYTQFSNNWHVYDASVSKADPLSAAEGAKREYPGTIRLVDDSDSFDDELRQYLEDPESARVVRMKNQFFWGTAAPMYAVNERRKSGDWAKARAAARRIAAPDWWQATVDWIGRRAK